MLKHAEDVEGMQSHPQRAPFLPVIMEQQFNLRFFLAAVDPQPGQDAQSLVGIFKERF